MPAKADTPTPSAASPRPRRPQLPFTRGWITNIISYLVVGLLAGVLGAAFYGYGIKNDQSTTNSTRSFTTVNEQSAIIDVAKKVSPSVVSITSSTNTVDFFGQSQTQQGAGTGIIVRSNGLILTNNHVVSGSQTVTVITNDKKTYKDAKVVATDPTSDLAFVQVNASGLPAAELGDSSTVQVGSSVIAIGNALGQFQNSVTAGIISGRRQSITAGEGSETENLTNLFQTDAAINPGNSGGPLVNIDGQVIGINTAVAGQGAQNIGFAIPINDAKADLASVEGSGKITKPFLGVRYVLITPDFATQNGLNASNGAYIQGDSGQSGVVSGSPAAQAGLHDGDIITKVNDTTIDENNNLTAVIGKFKPGDKVTITYLRNGKENKVSVTLTQNQGQQ